MNLSIRRSAGRREELYRPENGWQAASRLDGGQTTEVTHRSSLIKSCQLVRPPLERRFSTRDVGPRPFRQSETTVGIEAILSLSISLFVRQTTVKPTVKFCLALNVSPYTRLTPNGIPFEVIRSRNRTVPVEGGSGCGQTIEEPSTTSASHPKDGL